MIRIAIWRTHLLPTSEPWFRVQESLLAKMNPQVVGMYSLDTPLKKAEDFILFSNTKIGYLKAFLFKLTRYSFKLKRMLTLSRINLIHAHFLIDATYIYRIARILKLPLIVSVHGYDVFELPFRSGFSARFFQMRSLKTLQFSKLIICNSVFMKNEMLRYKVDPNKMIVHYLGVDTDRFKPFLGASRSGVLFVGRLVEHKGCEDLFRAVVQLPDNLKSTLITVIGQGPQEKRLRELSTELKLNVQFLGFQTQDRIIAEMQTTKLLCVPSKTSSQGWLEAFGLVFAEASACATPIVSYDAGGIPEVVKNGETGILAQLDNINDLSLGIFRILTDPAFAASLGNKGRQNVLATFDAKINARRLETILSRLIKYD